MKIEKLILSKEKIEINLEFYFYLKYLNKLSPSSNQINSIIENINLFKTDFNLLEENLEKIFLKSSNKLAYIKEILSKLTNIEKIELFNFSLKLYQIKDLLLEEAKISEALDFDKMSDLDPLSLEYDKISILKPYKVRINGALLTMMFFEKLNHGEYNFMSKDSLKFISDLSSKALKYKNDGLESNQIFMLMFSESINQSIISDSGSNYEERIKSVLNRIGIKNITKSHDKNDKSTEYDFFFEIDGKTFGIGAKRTLRERYKQFIKTAFTSKIDVSIEITLGLDLNKEKAKIITSHQSFIFVADEIYKARQFLKEMDHVYSVKDLTIDTLKNYQKNHLNNSIFSIL